MKAEKQSVVSQMFFKSFLRMPFSVARGAGGMFSQEN